MVEHSSLLKWTKLILMQSVHNLYQLLHTEAEGQLASRRCQRGIQKPNLWTKLNHFCKLDNHDNLKAFSDLKLYLTTSISKNWGRFVSSTKLYICGLSNSLELLTADSILVRTCQEVSYKIINVIWQIRYTDTRLKNILSGYE